MVGSCALACRPIRSGSTPILPTRRRRGTCWRTSIDTLVALDAQGQIVPALASSWSQSGDGLVWTFHLRPRVTFHDGSPLRASDAAFSIQRLKDPRLASPRAEDFAAVAQARAVDDQTLELVLHEPYGPLLAKLAYSMNAVVSESVVKKEWRSPEGRNWHRRVFADRVCAANATGPDPLSALLGTR